MSFSLSDREFYLAETHGIQHARQIIEASHGNGAGAPMTAAERKDTAFGPEDALEVYGSKNRGGMYEIAVSRDIARTVRRTQLIPEPDFGSVQAPPLPAAVVMPSVVELPSQVA
jgi:hypothetical protein